MQISLKVFADLNEAKCIKHRFDPDPTVCIQAPLHLLQSIAQGRTGIVMNQLAAHKGA